VAVEGKDYNGNVVRRQDTSLVRNSYVDVAANASTLFANPGSSTAVTVNIRSLNPTVTNWYIRIFDSGGFYDGNSTLMLVLIN
jgi:hypothetical protein